MTTLRYTCPTYHFVRDLFNIDALFAKFSEENLFGIPIQQSEYVHDPQMCKGSLLVNTLRDQALGHNIWISLWVDNQQVAATTFDFEYNRNQNCVVGIIIFTFCSNYYNGSNLMNIIKLLTSLMIDYKCMFARDDDTHSYITLNPTPDSLLFYQKHGFSYDQYNNICSISISSEPHPENDMHKKYLKYKQKYLNLKNKQK